MCEKSVKKIRLKSDVLQFVKVCKICTLSTIFRSWVIFKLAYLLERYFSKHSKLELKYYIYIYVIVREYFVLVAYRKALYKKTKSIG